MQVQKSAFDELSFNHEGNVWTTRFATEEMANEVLRRCQLYNPLVRALERCRDLICEEVADGQYHEIADFAADVLKKADGA